MAVQNPYRRNLCRPSSQATKNTDEFAMDENGPICTGRPGGGRSLRRTGLRCRFPAEQGIYREFDWLLLFRRPAVRLIASFSQWVTLKFPGFGTGNSPAPSREEKLKEQGAAGEHHAGCQILLIVFSFKHLRNSTLYVVIFSRSAIVAPTSDSAADQGRRVRKNIREDIAEQT